MCHEGEILHSLIFFHIINLAMKPLLLDYNTLFTITITYYRPHPKDEGRVIVSLCVSVYISIEGVTPFTGPGGGQDTTFPGGAYYVSRQGGVLPSQAGGGGYPFRGRGGTNFPGGTA